MTSPNRQTSDLPPARTFADRGGTFTDLVDVDEHGVTRVRKIASDHAVIGQLARGHLTLGTTVATNALLEGTGVPTLLVVTRGFRDLPEIGDMSRPRLFDPEAEHPPPRFNQVIEVEGRISETGQELEPVQWPTEPIENVDAVAIVLLNSHRNPKHEQAVEAWVRTCLPDAYISLGHHISPETGYLARIETTLVDASITPILRAALQQDEIPVDAMAIRSDGSLVTAIDLNAPDAVLSGPAGGVLAVAEVARLAGFRHAVGLDMGGTSTDVCCVDIDALPRVEGDVRVAGVRVKRPMLEIHTIAAGGGSILWSDGLRLGVGPRSAGAHPGPQCYGRGGPPTLTDAALVSGLVDPASFDPPLDGRLVHLPGDATEFLAIAREAMAAAVERIATARGLDIRDHALVAYGGAAGQHAARVAERLGIETVLIHPCAAVLSAWGQSVATLEESAVKALWLRLPQGWSEVTAAWETLRRKLPTLGTTAHSLELRHLGTDHGIEITVDPDDTPAAILQQFNERHRQRYGFDRQHSEVEVVNVRVRVKAPPTPLASTDGSSTHWPDGILEGPQVVFMRTTAIEIPKGWTARSVDGILRIDVVEPQRLPPPTTRTPFGVALWSNRFMAAAEQSGELLRRLARSVNIRERRDFSCAVFDGRGHLVANAPHIPVHLGAMGETVRDLLHQVADPPPGQAWLSNDPATGGSHLPDLTVVTAVHHDSERWFVASRGHHVDVGGLTPGSMPPHSRSLVEEGIVLRNVPLLEDGQLRNLTDILSSCRDINTVVADLEAQVAANAHLADLLVGMGPSATVSTWMGHLQDVAAECVAVAVSKLSKGHANDELDGVTLHLSLDPRDDRLYVDFRKTGGPHHGNLNAPHAVVRAAVLYGLRVLVGIPIPLNEGALRAVELMLPERSIVSPPPNAAVAGGNVETSQRLVDLFLRAAERMASSQGTMNNLTLGGDTWMLYETIGGGQGASPAGPGCSGRQVHMTNTRATDPEIMEARLPLRVRHFSFRKGSGGSGTHRGGDGLIREIEVTREATAALLATRRDSGAPGLGGGPGTAGRDRVCIAGSWEPWSGTPVRLQPGDRVRIETPGGGGWIPVSVRSKGD